MFLLSSLEEKSNYKCAKYWPETGCLSIKDIVIKATENNEFLDHVVRSFIVTRKGQGVQRLVKQFHFTAWPNRGIPNDSTTLLSFIRKVNKWRKNNIVQRVIIHCSGYVGRISTFITIDCQIKLIKKKQEVSIFAYLYNIRNRLLLVTKDQFIFIHNALLDYIDSSKTEIKATKLRKYIEESQSNDPGMTIEFNQLTKFEKKDQLNDTNHVDSYICKKFFIATKTPLEPTICDFLSMVWKQRCGAIVMISEEKEVNQRKFHPYFLTNLSTIGCFIIQMTKETTYDDYIVRALKLTNTEAGYSLSLRHFQFTKWPSKGSPKSGTGLIKLIMEVWLWNKTVNNKCSIVHCSDGVGKTGVFIALTNLIERVKVEGLVNVFQTVKKLKSQRPGMVQTKDQYEFCYRALNGCLDSFSANYR